jgi:hypothetical protein
MIDRPPHFPKVLAAAASRAAAPLAERPCLDCGRPIRLRRNGFGGYCVSPRARCDDCERLRRNQRNAERRRVKHAPMACLVCGEAFVPKRADAVTCSNRCRQAAHRHRLSPRS